MLFFSNYETTHHLFFDCPLAKFFWMITEITIELGQPNNIRNMYGGWVQNMNPKQRQLLFVGIGIMLWAV
jgi:hypothetical protein